jgi:hypothetical protein
MRGVISIESLSLPRATAARRGKPNTLLLLRLLWPASSAIDQSKFFDIFLLGAAGYQQFTAEPEGRETRENVATYQYHETSTGRSDGNIYLSATGVLRLRSYNH